MSDEQAVLAANKAFYRAFEKKDIDAMETVCSQGTASLCIHPGRAAIQGWSEIGRSWEQIFRATDYLEIDIKVLSTEISGDLAVVVLVENIMQIVGNRRLQASSTATNVFSRMAGQWYMIHHHGGPIV
ncbi:MAG: nuclear transport factor 2 family protein [Microcoleaceae cyanobacterium]